MVGKKWWDTVKKKFSPFKKNIFSVRNKHGKKSRVQVMRLNDHSFFKQRFNVYLSSKKKLLSAFGLSKAQIDKICEITPFAMAGMKAYQGQVVSLNAALEIKDFVRRNKELLIDIHGKGLSNKKSDPKSIDFVSWIEKSIDASLKNQTGPKHDLDYNPGIVERVDHILLPTTLHGSKPIILNRVLLMMLGDLESSYAKLVLGKKYDAFVEKDKLASKSAFGDGSELII